MNSMHNLLRAFVASCIFIQEASDKQINRRGADKALASVWCALPRLNQDVRKAASQLLADPRRGVSDPLENESKWLEALIDEIGAEDSRDGQETLDESESWSTIARGLAWLAFCLNQAPGYSVDEKYGYESFERVAKILAESDDYEKALAFAAITEAATHLESVDAESGKEIASAYDKLLAALSVSC